MREGGWWTPWISCNTFWISMEKSFSHFASVVRFSLFGGTRSGQFVFVILICSSWWFLPWKVSVFLVWDFVVGPWLCSFGLRISCIHFQRCWFELACLARPSELLSAEPILVLALILRSWDSVRFISSCSEPRRRFGFWSRPNWTLSQDSFWSVRWLSV
jgi:hypothetical protein